MIDVDLAALGAVARGWDEQHVDLDAAARRLASTGTAGFTPVVAGPAARFARAWHGYLDGLADAAEAHADGLRTTARELVLADDAARLRFVRDVWLRELR